MPMENQEEVTIPMQRYTSDHPHWTKVWGFLWTSLVLLDVLIYGSYGVLVHLSKVRGHLPYNSSSVVLFIELTKLCISSCLFLQELARTRFTFPQIPLGMLASYAVPGVLYCFNNNIALHMQLHMDPTTYQVLCNLKIGTTALLYRYIIKRELSSAKWVAIGLLLIAGLLDSAGGFQSKLQKGAQQIFITKLGLVMMFLYIVISGLAAVYTEYILKKQKTVSLNFQNMLLYGYGIVLNASLSKFGVGYSSPEADSNTSLLDGFSIYTWLIVLTQALNGLIMSIVMKHGSNITRLFIISGAMLTTTVLSVIVLGTMLNIWFVFAAAIVILAVYLYHM